MPNNFWDVSTKAATLATLITALFGTAYYFIALEQRLSTLEAQLQTFAFQPAVLNEKVASKLEDNSVQGSVNSSSPQPSALQSACFELAMKAADAYKRGTSITEALPIERMMERLGCEAAN